MGIQLVLGQQQAPQDNMLKKMFLKMMMKKMFSEHMDDDNESPFGSMGASKYSMDSDDSTKFKFFEKMMKSMNRNKRATDDLFELGDRLTEKLKSEQQKNASSIWQCLMRSPRARYRRPKPRNRCQRHG